MKKLASLPAVFAWAVLLAAGPRGEAEVLRVAIASEPKTFDPQKVAEEASETIRYLTGGVLVRLNRATQALDPELALSWRVLESGRAIRFELRPKVRFSDGTLFTAEDVAYTVRRLMSPDLHSPTADSFRSAPGEVTAKVLSPSAVLVRFPGAVAALARLFDQVAIQSSQSPAGENAVLGPFRLKDYEPGQRVTLERNPYYWKRDDQGRRLPYLDGVQLDIQQNRELEALRFRRGQLHLINKLDPSILDTIEKDAPGSTRDSGPSLEAEQLWFNQNPKAPIAAHKKSWFNDREFRRAVSEAINRNDLCDIVYKRRATPGIGPISPANRFWFNAALAPHPYGPAAASARLARAGFRRDGSGLRDRAGNVVDFTLVTNAGNKSRERVAAMIEQDLKKIGIRLRIVTLDFAALIEKMMKTFDYDACLLGLVNVDLDPSSQMNVWLSSGPDHIWNPKQPSPATAWEAEIDRLMRAQASETDDRRRKKLFDEVQRIAWEQAPFLYLVNRHALSAISPRLLGAKPVVLHPQAFWNVEWLRLASEPLSKR